MASSSITSWQIDEETMETVTDFIFLGSKITVEVTVAMKLKDTCFLEEKLWQTRQHIKKQRHYFADKGLSSQGMVPLDCKAVQPVHPKGNQS